MLFQACLVKHVITVDTHLGTECRKELDVRMELFGSVGKSLKIWNFTGIQQDVLGDQSM